MESKTGSSGSTNRSNTSLCFFSPMYSISSRYDLSRSISLPTIFMRCIKSYSFLKPKYMINRGDREKRNDPNLASKAHFIVCQFQFRSRKGTRWGSYLIFDEETCDSDTLVSSFNQKKKIYKKDLLQLHNCFGSDQETSCHQITESKFKEKGAL